MKTFIKVIKSIFMPEPWDGTAYYAAQAEAIRIAKENGTYVDGLATHWLYGKVR